ncbi:MAG TPA: 50S ribosomal protein L11 methyltransferase [Mobilitalea sp.]|nr:50S ribosomal protein L11 methyltransferase [Mobilitalea sp.]
MKWTKFTLDTTTDAVDLISDMLNDLGIEGIEVSDKVPITEEEKKRMFIDFLPELGEDDGLAVVSFYVNPSENSSDIMEKVKEGLAELSEYVSVGSGRIEVSETEDKDWINNWKEFFKPFRIDDTIVIKPTWEELKDAKDTDMVIEIDPGTSFGTGSHETTKLCILSLKKYMKPGFAVLDAGSGSGILSIIAKKLGAAEVLGIDIDPLATDSAIENAGVNKIAAMELKSTVKTSVGDTSYNGISFITGNIIEDVSFREMVGKDHFDLVVANILADVIIPLSAVIGENMKPGGIFISSGIINTKETAVEQALRNNQFMIIEVIRMGDWVSFVAQKNDAV